MNEKQKDQLYRMEIAARNRARSDDVDTAKAAAAPSKKHLVWACLVQHYFASQGLMDEELGDHHLDHRESYRRRGSDLRALGYTEWLMEDGKPVKRATMAHGKARVSIITQKGRDAYLNSSGGPE